MKLFWRPRPQVVLETERFTLRSLTNSRAARLTYPWSFDPQVMDGFNERAGHFKRRRWRRRYKRFDNRCSFCFGIWPKTGGDMIGCHMIAMPKSRDHANFMVMIGDKDWWGKQVVTEVRGFLIDWLFETTPVHRIAGMTHSRNFPSIFNYKHLGFTFEGAMREHYPGLEGGRVDMLMFGLLRREWEAKRNAAKEASP